MPRVNTPVGTRTVGTKLRFVAHVVEGEGNENPGRIRTIRFDRSGGDQIWLNTQWKNGADGTSKTLLTAYDVNADMQDKGAFLLVDEYKKIGRPDLYDDYMEYENRKVPGQAWPQDLLPPRVRELQEIKKERYAGNWKPPEKSLDGPPSETAEAKPQADDGDEDDMPSIGGSYKPKVRKGSK